MKLLFLGGSRSCCSLMLSNLVALQWKEYSFAVSIPCLGKGGENPMSSVHIPGQCSGEKGMCTASSHLRSSNGFLLLNSNDGLGVEMLN
jgi:hypothetical protein